MFRNLSCKILLRNWNLVYFNSVIIYFINRKSFLGFIMIIKREKEMLEKIGMRFFSCKLFFIMVNYCIYGRECSFTLMWKSINQAHSIFFLQIEYSWWNKIRIFNCTCMHSGLKSRLSTTAQHHVLQLESVSVQTHLLIINFWKKKKVILSFLKY